ncbi:MAG: ROK family protein [Salinibacter sp.]|uniref:ROK family protein n=1 Tax=Salinibacter sp. TaxID=2065818 RepID=UPI0035D42460
MPSRIGIDLGATNIRTGLVEDRTLSDVRQAPTPADGDREDVLEQIYALLDAAPTAEVASIGAGVPSVVDAENGIVYDVVNIPSWDEVPLGPLLEQRYDTPAFVQNDANCFALAEYHFGSGGGQSPMVGLILGTGFAGGIVVNGELFSGRNCGAGEFGTAPYRDSIYEHYCAGLFFEREHGISGKEAFERAQKGDEEAITMFEEMGTHLGHAIKSVLCAVDPAHIVVGGSVRHAYPFFEEAMWAEIETFAFSRTLDNLTLDLSGLEHAGVLGAAALGF